MIHCVYAEGGPKVETAIRASLGGPNCSVDSYHTAYSIITVLTAIQQRTKNETKYFVDTPLKLCLCGFLIWLVSIVI